MTFTLDPVELSIECAGQKHRLRWADGTLTAMDHADTGGERTLAALGGEPVTCIQILDTWSRYDSDLAVLVSASRGQHDPLVPLASHGGGGFIAMNQGGTRRRRPRPGSS
jgi:alpha-beta hydrolase superfamily lysophospholipase